MVKPTFNCALLLAITLCVSAAQAMPSYEWVDVQRENTTAGVDYGTIRLVYTSSSPDSTEHTYRLTAGGGLWGLGTCTEAEVYASEFEGEYIFDFGFVQSGNTYTTNFIDHQAPNPTPSWWISMNEAPSNRMRAVAWGPERNDNQNGDGIHEDREWIDVRISWTGGVAPGGTIDPGTVTYRLVPQGNKKYKFTGPVSAMQMNGQDYAQLRATVQFMGDDSIEADVINFTGRLDMDWGKAAGSGDYTGPLDADGGPNEASVYEFVIIGQGPTVGGPGDDPIEPGDDDGGGDGGGDGPGGDPPDEEDIPGDGDVPISGIECLDDFLEELENIPAVKAFMELHESIAGESKEFEIKIKMPKGVDGEGVSTEEETLTVSTTPDVTTEYGAKLDAIRLVVRAFILIGFGWALIKGILDALIRW